MKAFHNKDGKPVLMRMVSGIKENKDYLGEIDGLIGDGDHGMNMNKGFSLFQQRFEKETFDLSEGLRELGMILLNERCCGTGKSRWAKKSWKSWLEQEQEIKR